MKEVKGRGNQEDSQAHGFGSPGSSGMEEQKGPELGEGECSFIRCIQPEAMANSFGHVRQEQRGGASLESQQDTL